MYSINMPEIQLFSLYIYIDFHENEKEKSLWILITKLIDYKPKEISIRLFHQLVRLP